MYKKNQEVRRNSVNKTSGEFSETDHIDGSAEKVPIKDNKKNETYRYDRTKRHMEH